MLGAQFCSEILFAKQVSLQNFDKIGMSKQTIFILIFIIIVAATGFLWYRYYRQSPAVIAGESEKTPEELEEELSRAKRLKGLQIDISVFQDKFFKSLEVGTSTQFGVALGEKPGRPNPFLPF